MDRKPKIGSLVISALVILGLLGISVKYLFQNNGLCRQWSGVIVEKSTQKPIKDAVVIRIWQATQSGFKCFKEARSDQTDRFTIKPPCLELSYIQYFGSGIENLCL